MNLIELNRALGQLRLGGIAAVLETRIRQAQAEAMPPIDFLSCLVSELTRRGERLLERRTKQAEFAWDGLLLLCDTSHASAARAPAAAARFWDRGCEHKAVG
jgi:hypothetical protein